MTDKYHYYSDGSVLNYRDFNKTLHRIDGPAVEYAWAKYWFVDDKLHRTDGPAIEGKDGYKAWHQDNKRHRLDGPAIECSDGTKEWWIRGKEYTKAEYDKQILIMRLSGLLDD